MELKFWIYLALLALAGTGLWIACKKPLPGEGPKPALTEVKHPDWTRDAVIYEINVRQFSKEGSFAAIESHLPRLKSMGIDILWLMPIHPIGIKNRKGPLGSYYSVRDYKAVNPEFGSMDDFVKLVSKVHEHGMKIIIDWVPNHSAWDNPLTKTNPEFYMKDSLGRFVSAFDWTDVIRFDYNNEGLRKYMISTLQWWLKETGIDGFRCDVAHMIPKDFWNDCRVALDSIKPVFFVAEADQPFLHEKAFDMSYDWKFHHIMNDIAKGKKSAKAVKNHFEWVDSVYPGDSYLMQFTSNHDENSWNGTEFERLGQGAKTFAVLSATIPDMLLMYNGQESAFDRRLKFFEKDSISWGSFAYQDFYTKLIALKKNNTALFNGIQGGKLNFLSTGKDSAVVAFTREAGNDKVLVLCNLTSKSARINVAIQQEGVPFRELFTAEEKIFKNKERIELAPWEFKLYYKSSE